MREKEGFHCTQRGKRKRRRMRGGIVAVGCFACFSPFGHVHHGGKVGLSPSLSLSLFKSVKPLSIFSLFILLLLFLCPSILPFSPHFLLFPYTVSIFLFILRSSSFCPLHLYPLNTLTLPSLLPCLSLRADRCVIRL